MRAFRLRHVVPRARDDGYAPIIDGLDELLREVDEGTSRDRCLAPGRALGLDVLLRGASRSLDAVRTASNSKKNHPLHGEMDTSRVDGVKAPLHNGTPRSHRREERVFELLEVSAKFRSQLLWRERVDLLQFSFVMYWTY